MQHSPAGEVTNQGREVKQRGLQREDLGQALQLLVTVAAAAATEVRS